MPDPIPQSILCPVLIGRDAQVAALARLLEQARSGQGQIALVSGEAGIGKSRLVAEAKLGAEGLGFVTLQGNCFETERNLPYAPWLDLLRTLDEQRVLPAAIRSLFFAPTLAQNDPAQSRQHLFETLTTFLLNWGENQPLHVIIEDAHWCDDLSIEFLLHFVRRIRNQPIILLLTYRDNEVSSSLERLLTSLNRQRLAQELPCRRLSLLETASMVQAVFALKRPPQTDFVNQIYELTEGNPFFIEEVLKACVAEGAIFQSGGQWGRKPLSQITIPRTVQVAVQQRVTPLTPAAQRLLTLAAVAGQRCDFDLLLRVAGQDEKTLITLLNELRAAQLVVEAAPDHFSFRHALTRQAIYNGLLARERRLHHRSVAEALETMAAEMAESATQTATLAHHFAAAALWEKTLHYARRAGEQAQALHSPRSVVEQFSRALDAAQQLGLPAPLALLRARGQAHEMLGDFAAARADLAAVLAATQGNADRQGEWQALLDLGFLWTSRDFAAAGAFFQQALTLARQLGDPIMLGQTLNRIGNWHVNMGQPHAGRTYHEEALALFQAVDDPAGVAATLDLLAGAAHFAGDIRQGMDYYRQAAQRFRTLGDRRGLASTLSWLAFQCATALNWRVVVAPLPACTQLAEEALQMARAIQWRPGEAFALIALAFVRAVAGDYGDALALANEALAITQDLQHGWATVAGITLGSIYLDLGDFPSAQRELATAVALSQQWNIGFGIDNATAYFALALLRQGESSAAEAALVDKFGNFAELALPESAEEVAHLTLKQRLYWAVRAELALAQNDVAAAAAISAALVAAAQHGNPASNEIVARLWLLQAHSEIAQAQWTAASATLQRAHQAAVSQGARPLLWRIDALRGQLAQRRGDQAAAEEQFSTARRLLETLAATLPDLPQREKFLSYALSHLPAPQALTPRRAAKAIYAGLTERERQVAALIAQGKSDREIAEELVLSKRTASTHVTNILNKLGFSSRSQIAAWAAQKRLLDG